MYTDTEKIQEAARRLRASLRLVVLTGAGVSRESGVPTFRDALETQYVCDAVLKSARTDRWEKVTKAK